MKLTNRGSLTPSEIWSSPISDLHMFLCLDQSLLRLPCLWTLNIANPFVLRIYLNLHLNLHLNLFKFTLPNWKGFHRIYATGVACQQGTLTLPDTWFRPPFWDLLVLQLLRPNSSNLPCLYSTFHIEYPLVLSRFCLFSLPCFDFKLCEIYLTKIIQINRVINKTMCNSCFYMSSNFCSVSSFF